MLNNARPVIATADGKNRFAIRDVAQFDTIVAAAPTRPKAPTRAI